jgi:hypothetical protein
MKMQLGNIWNKSGGRMVLYAHIVGLWMRIDYCQKLSQKDQYEMVFGNAKPAVSNSLLPLERYLRIAIYHYINGYRLFNFFVLAKKA